MKKTLLLLFLSTAFVGCKKDSSSNSAEANATLVGDWKYTRSNYHMYDSKGNILINENTTSFSGGDHNVYRADGTGSSYSNPSEAPFTYTFSNGVLVEVISPSLSVSYKVTISGKKKLNRHADYVYGERRIVLDKDLQKTNENNIT